jgi:hypothetical protein
MVIYAECIAACGDLMMHCPGMCNVVPPASVQEVLKEREDLATV